MRFSILIVLFVVGLFVQSCKKDIEVPAYLHIRSVDFKSKAGQGNSLQNITHVGIYIDDNLEGIYPVPSTFPILKKGFRKIAMRAFIKRLSRDGYINHTMFTGDTAMIDLKEGEVDTLSPVFQYQPNTKFAWLDDFNNNTRSLKVDSLQSSIDTIYVTKGKGVDTSFYAFIDMGPDPDPFFSVESEDKFILPIDGRDVFLEFHYKCNIPFTVGLLEFSSQQEISLPSVTPYETGGEWRKGYVYLNDELARAPSGATYKVTFRAANGDKNIRGELYLDNLKLMYRE